MTADDSRDRPTVDNPAGPVTEAQVREILAMADMTQADMDEQVERLLDVSHVAPDRLTGAGHARVYIQHRLASLARETLRLRAVVRAVREYAQTRWAARTLDGDRTATELRAILEGTTDEK